jgi:hypothetical protein
VSYQQGHGDALADKEILREENRELRVENVRLRLTDEEREAIDRIAGYHDIHVSMDDRETLRGLLERMK